MFHYSWCIGNEQSLNFFLRREYCIEHGGPSGGNGGNGGSVYFECDKTMNTLSQLRRKVHHKAGDGTNGRGDSRHGQKGDDVVIMVPPGTIVRDQVRSQLGAYAHSLFLISWFRIHY